MTQVIIIGAGVGGLTTAAILAKAGLTVIVLEAHVYPGGCAGTFYHKGYYFDAGATLAGGFYPQGPMDKVAQACNISTWQTFPSEVAMVVHMPDGMQITRWTGSQRWPEREAKFGPEAHHFWRWQEKTADMLWSFALSNPAWPPQTFRESIGLLKNGISWLQQNPKALATVPVNIFRPISTYLKNTSKQLQLFVDGQLLISAQATSQQANALYAASALDFPRRGVVHFKGGMGSIAKTLAAAVQDNGGQIFYRQEVTQVQKGNSERLLVQTKRKKQFEADMVVFNLPPWNIVKLLGNNGVPKFKHLRSQPSSGWGAFMVYVGFDGAIVPPEFPLHHQIIVQEPLGEGNSIFISLNPAWDTSRGPNNDSVLTISTHTDFRYWANLFEHNQQAYQQQKEVYTERILKIAETVLPGLKQAANLILPGTPITFQRFTRRAWGWVGGFPQTSLFNSWGPRLTPNMWMVGDSIFPGQSTAAVALGGMRVANAILSVV